MVCVPGVGSRLRWGEYLGVGFGVDVRFVGYQHLDQGRVPVARRVVQRRVVLSHGAFINSA